MKCRNFNVLHSHRSGGVVNDVQAIFIKSLDFRYPARIGTFGLSGSGVWRLARPGTAETPSPAS